VVTPLAAEYTRYGANYGMRRRDEELGSPVLARLQTFNGRSYSATEALRPPDEMAAHQKVALAKRRALARRLRRDWDERYLPELNEQYAWMRALSLDSVGGGEAASAWDDLWRRHRRAWRIHMLVTAGAYAVMDELADTYQTLVGGSQTDAFAQRLLIPTEDPEARRSGLRWRADQLAAQARTALAGRPEDLARFEEVLAAACATGPLTEEHNYWLDRRNHANMGRAARTFGTRLVRDGVLREREEIFLLYLNEVRDALRSPRDLSALIAEREAEQERWRSLGAPETIGDP